jgi:hypothetical protein
VQFLHFCGHLLSVSFLLYGILSLLLQPTQMSVTVFQFP